MPCPRQWRHKAQCSRLYLCNGHEIELTFLLCAADVPPAAVPVLALLIGAAWADGVDTRHANPMGYCKCC